MICNLTPRHHKIVIAILLIIIAALAFYAGHLKSRYQTVVSENQRAETLLRQAPEHFQGQAQAFARDLQGKAAGTFQNLLGNMQTFQKLNQETEMNVMAVAKNRESALAALQVETTSAGSFKQALKVLDLDTELIQAYQDWVRLQEMHRQRIIEKLYPLASDLGLDT